jgi:flavin reductase (DIM6/NTAB) family NADH-FMN oxidoreductase RutF
LLDPSAFRRTCARYATGIAIATVLDSEGAPHGMTINSFTSVSLVPPIILFCVDFSSNLIPMFRAGSHCGVNVLAETQQQLSERFAKRGMDKFNEVEWEAGSSGSPLIPGCLAQLECAITSTVDAGDHLVVFGEVKAASCAEGRPLLYFGSRYRRLDQDLA